MYRNMLERRGRWGVEYLQTALDDFLRLLGERGIGVDAFDAVPYLYLEIRHPLTELTAFLRGETSEILSNLGAGVFVRALEGSFEGLRRIAGEIGREYGRRPEEVVRMSGLRLLLCSGPLVRGANRSHGTQKTNGGVDSTCCLPTFIP